MIGESDLSKPKEVKNVRLNSDQLVDLFNIENNSSIPHFKNIAAMMQSPEMLSQKLRNFNVTSDEEILQRLYLQIKLSSQQGGIGWAVTTENKNIEGEEIICSIVCSAFRDSAQEPLVIGIDDFYRYESTSALSIVDKIYRKFSYSPVAQGKKFAVVLSGVSESFLFTEDIVRRVPYQADFRDSDEFSHLNTAGFSKLMEKHGTPQALTSYLKSKYPSEGENLTIIIAAILFATNGQQWQSLCYEHNNPTQARIPVFIVAPRYFHDAMLRTFSLSAHTNFEYQYRAAHSLGAYKIPILEKHPYREDEKDFPESTSGNNTETLNPDICLAMLKILKFEAENI